MILAIASGKGGTGKTTVAVNLAFALDNVQLIDCDVEEPDAHIFLKPQIASCETVYTVIPHTDKNKCNFCGLCSDICAYGAINIFKNSDKDGTVLILDNLCHGCGACSLLCPQKAISEQKKEIGIIESGHSSTIEYHAAKLKIGDVKTAFLIRELKKKINRDKTVILDCPPGTSCPMVASVSESDFCLLVTEPSPFGLNDLALAVETIRKLKIPHGVFINRADQSSILIENYCTTNNIPLLGSLGLDIEIAKKYSRGEILSATDEKYKKIFSDLAKECNNIFLQNKTHGA